MLRLLFIISMLGTFLISGDIAIVKKVSGDIFVKRAEKNIKISIGDQLQEGDLISTKKNSNVGMVFHDGTMLSLGENSILSVDKYIFKPLAKKFVFDINMKKGLATFESGKIGKLAPESVKFRVPEGTVGIRGTKFYVEVK